CRPTWARRPVIRCPRDDPQPYFFAAGDGGVLAVALRRSLVMADSIILVEKRDNIATVTLNRPEKLNAFNRELRAAFCRVMQELRTDPEAGVVIITGAGRAFCAGMDLRELGGGLREEGNVTFISVIEELNAPVIAAVNGFAITGGFELALACDMIIASEDAQFADTHARVGVMPGGGISARLPRAAGIRKAKEMSLTGNYLSARDAEGMGLVNRVVPKDQVLKAAKELAGQILSCDQTVVRLMKRLYDRTTRVPLGEAIQIEQDFFRAFNRGVRALDLEQRRTAVMERGRTQATAKQ
ncbi:MAG: enoyl-CoA hydratase, partial [Candidatus Binataceae bacterium]